MLLNHPLKLGQHLIGLHTIHRRRLELFPQGNELHVLLAVLVDFAEKDLGLVDVFLVLEVEALLSSF
jgi:hypothetical protein